MKTKKIIGLLLAGAMAATAAGCNSASDEPPLASKENVFSSREIEIPEFGGGDYGYLSGMCFYDGNILLFKDCSESTELEDGTYESKSWTVAAMVDLEGNLISQFELERPGAENPASNGSFRSFSVDSDGAFSGVFTSYEFNETTFESKETSYLIKFDKEGKISSSVDLSEAGKDEEYFYISDVITDDSGNAYFASNNAVYATDQNGKVIFESKGGENSWISSIFKTGDGRIFLCENVNEITGDEVRSYMTLKQVDSEKGGFGAEYELEGTSYQFMGGNESYDAYFSTDTSLYGYDIETDERTLIIDWLKAGFDVMTMNGINVLPGAGILCQTYNYTMSPGGGYSYSHNDIVLTHLTKLDPSEVPDKKLITLATVYLDYNLRNAIVEFNKTNLEYQIEVKSYLEASNVEDAVTKFNNDLTAGNIPDLIVNSSYYGLPMSSYISKGLIEDIYSLMDEDESINKEDYIPNVFNALEEDGGLYRLFTSFNITTAIGKTSDVGSEKGWSIDDLNKLLATKPEGTSAFSDMTKESFIMMVITMCQDEFIDLETGRCSFDNDEFIGLLELANKFPKEINYDNFDQRMWEERETAYRNGNPLLMYAYLYDFASIRTYEVYNFGEEVTFKGFPNAGGNSGSAFNAGVELSVAEKASNKDGAWAFLKFLMTDAQDDPRFINGFPIKLSALEDLKEFAKQKPFWVDENGVKQEYENSRRTSSGEEIIIGENTDADNEKIMDLINSVSYVARYDENINKIVSEETAAFFEGQKSAAEAAGIIQNRVNLYVSENS